MQTAAKRVGIIGGGQLAWMMAAGAKKLGLELIVQTPKPDDPAVAIATQTIFAAVDDAAATAQLAALCDVITFENEFIDLAALTPLAQQIPFRPRLSALTPLLDKLEQRSYLKMQGIPTPKFMALPEDAAEFEKLGFPVVLKARRHGYDGKGTFIIQDSQQLQERIKGLDQEASEEWFLEEFVPFQCELAVMVVRSLAGEILTYPVVETQQVNQVCQRVLALSQWDEAIVQQVEAIAQVLLTQLEFVGIMGIEFFLTSEGRVLVNETAPRTHNSGHYSLDACRTSQFEQQLRAVCGLPLGDPGLHTPAVMVNLLGYESAEQDYLSQRQTLEQIPHAHVYWYGKTVARPGRKMGHVTVLLETPERHQALAITQEIEAIWAGQPSP